MVTAHIKNWVNNKLFSLSGYVIISVVIIHLLLIPILYFTLVKSYKSSVYEQFIEHSTNISGMISDVLSTAKSTKLDREISALLEPTVLSENIVYLRVINHQGKQLYLYKESENNRYVEDKDVNKNDDGTYYMSFPVYLKNSNNNISLLEIGFDESIIVEDYNEIKYSIAVIMLIYFISVLVLFIALLGFIHKPLHLLRKQSREIVDGNVDVPLTNKSRLKEIKFLTDDLEKMRGTLVGLVDKMQHKATHDDLTGLPNRYLFGDRLSQCISSAERENKTFSILFLDLDRFKEINDTLGHDVGDDVLKIVSERMHKSLRESDTIARIGGDEFSFILANVTKQEVKNIACKLIDILKPEFVTNDHILKIGASIGVSMYPENGTSPELLMKRADVAMYHAKYNHMDFSFYEKDMDSDHYEKLVLANDMKESINTGLFEALVQPKIDIKENKICGCEMLLRWNHPDLGLILPEKFIPMAETENLIGDITRWAVSNHLHEFLDVVKENPDFHIAINVSPIDLLDRGLLEAINGVIKYSQFPESNLYIEVTENAIMKNLLRSAEILNEFDNEGYVLSIDDFGTGYSSLAYLQKFPISELKIDKSFIKDLRNDSNNYPIVLATIRMAHDLGMLVVAEGVEDESVIEILKEIGCDRAQGYYYASPMKIDDFKQWYKSYNY